MRRTPQEKKRLTYLKDRRNDYGENDKASRKNIPRHRARTHRANRRRTRAVLMAAADVPDPVAEDMIEQRLNARRPHTWKKWRDIPLGQRVGRQLRRRVRLGIDAPGPALGRIERIERRQRRR